MRMKKFQSFTLPAIGQGAGGDDICDDAHRIKVLQYGIDLGMTLIDTAEVYRDGHSEKIVGSAIKGRRDKVFISTKFGPEHHKYEDVIKALEGSLRRLGVEYIDLYQIHWPNPAVPVEETMKALLYLKDSGKILHIGVSNFGMSDLLRAQEACGGQIRSNQVEFNLFERSPEKELLPYAEENDIVILAYTPLRRGRRGEEKLKTLAGRYGKTPTQIALNWIVSRKNVIAIPKTLNLEHVKENALAGDFVIEEKDLDELWDAFKPVITEVPTRRIRVLASETDPVYLTLDEAVENRFNLHPDVRTIAQDIRDNKILKPVQIVPTSDNTGEYDYDLVQGRLRYWAWIMAFGEDRPITACIRD